MATIVKGTTPTIKYTFRIVDPAEFVKAYITIKQNGKIILEKNLRDAETGEGYISWTLTQEETLGITKGKITARLNWKTADGTRGTSSREIILIEDNEKNEVI